MGGAGDARILQQQQQERQKAADKQWQTVLDQNKGGKTGYDGFTTDFESAGGYKGLQKMIENADPGALMAVSQHWASVADTLKTTAAGLVTHVNTMLEHWTGPSADAFRANAQTLHESLTNGSQYATIAQNAMAQASNALTTAKHDFPSAPSELDQIGSALGGSSDIQFKQDAAKYGLAQAVKKDSGDLSAWEQVHQEAVVVMEQLGTSYNASAAAMGNMPGGSVGGTGAWPSPPHTDQNGGVGGYGDNPRAPRRGGDVGLQPITGGNGGGHDGFNPGQNGGSGYLPGGGGIDGVHGGQGTTPPPGIGGTLDGGLGGPKTGIDAGGGIHGGPGFGGVTGIGGGGGGGAGFGGGGGGLGGFGGLGGGGLRTGAGMAEGEGVNGISGSRKAGVAAEGEGAGGAGEGQGMGMGGAHGMGSGSQNKKKRKARAGYLVEDEETWSADGASNPGVIDF